MGSGRTQEFYWHLNPTLLDIPWHYQDSLPDTNSTSRLYNGHLDFSSARINLDFSSARINLDFICDSQRLTSIRDATTPHNRRGHQGSSWSYQEQSHCYAPVKDQGCSGSWRGQQARVSRARTIQEASSEWQNWWGFCRAIWCFVAVIECSRRWAATRTYRFIRVFIVSSGVYTPHSLTSCMIEPLILEEELKEAQKWLLNNPDCVRMLRAKAEGQKKHRCLLLRESMTSPRFWFDHAALVTVCLASSSCTACFSGFSDASSVLLP